MALTSDVSRRSLARVSPQTVPVKAGQVFFKGSIVTIKSGLAYNATNSDQTHVALGVAYQSITSAQSSGGDGAANGGADILVEPGMFGDFTPDAAANNPSYADRFSTVYIVDDDTLSKSSAGSTRCSVTLYGVSSVDNVSLVAQFNEVVL